MSRFVRDFYSDRTGHHPIGVSGCPGVVRGGFAKVVRLVRTGSLKCTGNGGPKPLSQLANR